MAGRVILTWEEGKGLEIRTEAVTPAMAEMMLAGALGTVQRKLLLAQVAQAQPRVVGATQMPDLRNGR